jgi:thiamine-monophosphate kinase
MINPETPVGVFGERALLRHLKSRIPLGPGVVVGVGDDAAAVESGALTLITTDSLVEDVHFRRDWSPPRLLGRKALSVNLSDLAAMAAVPRYATVSLCLPPDLPVGFVDSLYDGLLERAAETGVSFVGGNLAATRGGIVVDVTLVGQGDRILRRSGAVAGDLVVVTGAFGASSAGLQLLADGARLSEDSELMSFGAWTETSSPSLLHCLRAHLDPQPPLAFGRSLSEQELAHAAIDVSDGLTGDLRELCVASGVGAWVQPEDVPVDAHASGLERARGRDGLALALHGGEDYQLLMAVPPGNMGRLRDLAVIWDLPLTVIGAFMAGEGEVWSRRGEDLVPLPSRSHEHFRVATGDTKPEA